MSKGKSGEAQHEEEFHHEEKTNPNGFGDGQVLEQLGTFLKANWKPLLKEIAIAGVTTYVSYRAKFLWRKKKR